jgi:nitrite reductase/ring-hydroxylating ferredoxin subunit
MFRKHQDMEWIRIFSSENEARERLHGKNTQLLIIRGQRICLALYRDEFFAVQDACSHNSESLSKGRINGVGEIVCPWHGYRFELRSGKPCDSSCPDLRTFPVKHDASGFFIGI